LGRDVEFIGVGMTRIHGTEELDNSSYGSKHLGWIGIGQRYPGLVIS